MLLQELFSGFALLRQKGERLRFATPRQRTTDNGQWIMEGKAGIRNYETTEATPDNGQRTTDNGGQSRLIAHGSRLTTHCPKNITTL